MNTKAVSPLKRARKRAGLTLHEVASRLKATGVKPCSLSSVHCWERGWIDVPAHVRPHLDRILSGRKPR